MAGATWGGSFPGSRVTMYDPSTTPGDGAAARLLWAIVGAAVSPREMTPSRTPRRTARERNADGGKRRSSVTGGAPFADRNPSHLLVRIKLRRTIRPQMAYSCLVAHRFRGTASTTSRTPDGP